MTPATIAIIVLSVIAFGVILILVSIWGRKREARKAEMKMMKLNQEYLERQEKRSEGISLIGTPGSYTTTPETSV